MLDVRDDPRGCPGAVVHLHRCADAGRDKDLRWWPAVGRFVGPVEAAPLCIRQVRELVNATAPRVSKILVVPNHDVELLVEDGLAELPLIGATLVSPPEIEDVLLEGVPFELVPLGTGSNGRRGKEQQNGQEKRARH